MEEKNKVAVVIPYYKNELISSEQKSLQACVRTLGTYNIILITPKSLDKTEICQKYPLLKVKTFEDEYFHSLRSYNKLMLSENFYSQFTDYTYILIYQLDAFVFKDELQLWAEKDYDYIGAPWIRSKKYPFWGGIKKSQIKRIWYRLTYNKKRLYKSISGEIGNGGFSLRKVNKMLQIARLYKEKIAKQLDDNKPFYPEDVWLLFELKNKDRLKKPSFKEALKFAMETTPNKAYQWNNNTLPFGCHAFSRNSYKEFWSPFINSALEYPDTDKYISTHPESN